MSETSVNTTSNGELFNQEWIHQGHESSRGRLLIASCRSGDYMARRVAEDYRRRVVEAGGNQQDVALLQSIDFQFSDGETGARLEEDVSGTDAFLFQSLADPRSDRSIDQNLMALLVSVRALRHWGANYVTVVLPYLAYSRQDRPTKFRREPTTAQLVADLIKEAGASRVVTWHMHSERIRGFYGSTPVDALEAVGMFVRLYQRFAGRDDVIAISPDTGATKFVTRIARELGIRAAVTAKFRPRPEEAQVSDIMGDFEGKRVAIIIDDMISTGGTVSEVARRLVEDKGIEEVYVGVSHNLCNPAARERLQELREGYGLQEVVVTNSIPQTDLFRSLPYLTVVDLSETFSRVINSIHYNRSLQEPFYGDLRDVPRISPEEDLTHQHEDNEVTLGSELSFPASDPPSWTGSTS